MRQRLQPLDSCFRGNDGENTFALERQDAIGHFAMAVWYNASQRFWPG